jgi:26S proteasome regulatory subunit N7
MTPFYLSICDELKWPVDKELVAKMQRANEEKLKQLEDNIKDAVENLGESEVREANLAKAEYLNLIGDLV